MKLLYLACHPWLEQNDLTIFKNLGIDVFSTGFFQDPTKPFCDYVTPLSWSANKELFSEFKSINPDYKCNYDVDLKLTKSFVDKFDVIIVTWWFKYLDRFWDLFKDKVVLFQTVGQSDPSRENSLKLYRQRGVKIIRMSESEKNFPGFCGMDAVIDLSVDTSIYKPWIGDELSILSVNKMMWRTKECNVNEYLIATSGFNRKLYGTDNDSIKEDFNLGPISPENLIDQYSKSRLSFSLGTKPGPVTLTFKQSLAAGCPVVTWGPRLGGALTGARTYTAYKYLVNGENGFFSDDLQELRNFIHLLLTDHSLAKRMSEKAIETSKQFSIQSIQVQWKTYFKSLGIEL